ncbi:unnamed protein product [Ilex paraguariensis]|uniref:Uncharacterized protein n=1 Tax=Ilex paraguariensis TaxID=185542 RepID=A0ABC8RQ83_9AQUA
MHSQLALRHVQLAVGGLHNNVPEISMLRSAAPRDTGKSPISQAPTSGMPFKEQHLKQLRAQCLVFLAFRNGLMPKKVHLEIALGNFFPKEDGPPKELIDNRGKDQYINEVGSIPEVTVPFGRLDNASERDRRIPPGPSPTGSLAEGNLSKEAEKTTMMEDKNDQPYGLSERAEERNHLLGGRKLEDEAGTQETSESRAFAVKGPQPDSKSRGIAVINQGNDLDSHHGQTGMANRASPIMGIVEDGKDNTPL